MKGLLHTLPPELQTRILQYYRTHLRKRLFAHRVSHFCVLFHEHHLKELYPHHRAPDTHLTYSAVYGNPQKTFLLLIDVSRTRIRHQYSIGAGFDNRSHDFLWDTSRIIHPTAEFDPQAVPYRYLYHYCPYNIDDPYDSELDWDAPLTEIVYPSHRPRPLI